MPLFYEDRTYSKAVGFECNRCHLRTQDEFEMQERIHIGFTAGFAGIWGDGNSVDIVLCQKCGYELLKPFAHINGVPP